MGLTKRERLLIKFTIVFGILALYYQFFLSNQLTEIKRVQSDIYKEKNLYNNLRLLDIKNLNNSLSKIKEKINIANEQLPDYENIEEFVISIDDLIGMTKVRFKGLNFNSNSDLNNGSYSVNEIPYKTNQNKNKQNKDYREIIVNLSVSGDYESIISFIGHIQNLKRINKINSFEISKDETMDDLVLNMNMAIYSLNDKGGSNLKGETPDGKSDPFKSLISPISIQAANTQYSQQTDINKILTESLNKAKQMQDTANTKENNNQNTNLNNIQENSQSGIIDKVN